MNITATENKYEMVKTLKQISNALDLYTKEVQTLMNKEELTKDELWYISNLFWKKHTAETTARLVTKSGGL